MSSEGNGGDVRCGVSARMMKLCELRCDLPVGHAGPHRDRFGEVDFEEADAVTGASARIECGTCGRDTVAGDCYGCEADRQRVRADAAEVELARVSLTLDAAGVPSMTATGIAFPLATDERIDALVNRAEVAETEVERLRATGGGLGEFAPLPGSVPLPDAAMGKLAGTLIAVFQRGLEALAEDDLAEGVESNNPVKCETKL